MFKRIFEYIRIFEYFPPNIDIRIRFVVILNAEYYSNIRIFCPNISEYLSLKIRVDAWIKGSFIFIFNLKRYFFKKSYNFFWYFCKSFNFGLQIIQNIWILEYLELFKYWIVDVYLMKKQNRMKRDIWLSRSSILVCRTRPLTWWIKDD